MSFGQPNVFSKKKTARRIQQNDKSALFNLCSNARGQQRNYNVNIPKQCYKCGNEYNQNHLQCCPAKDKICSKCAKRGHFAKVCRSKNVNYLGNRQDEQQEEIETESLETENDPVTFADFTSNNGWDEYQIGKFRVMVIAESFEIKNTIILSEEDLNGHIVKLKTNSGELFAIADSGSPMSFLKKKNRTAYTTKR